ncbi:P-type conjugative transfer protein TrbJ [Sphingomonas sp.]|uniref:P-type conjugative transfer protein TrbJ n=1 Tax=Sphingomonas sp. TaxID=28214 RepID=UPI0025EBFAF7|nr:P-type conjugative transfer protein TrbJ [Sphingomonas sp.]
MTRNYALALLASISIGVTAGPIPAIAALPVFDPSNYAQNLLIAARTLQQINNQIRSLQNEATMLSNQARNLTRIGFPQIQQLTQALQSIDTLMNRATNVTFSVSQADAQARALFPGLSNLLTLTGQRVVDARQRYDAAMAGFRQSMSVQSQVVTNVQSDAQTMNDIVNRSQNADGALQAQQATNQLLALTAKQQFQLQTLMAAQYRSEAIERARQLQAGEDARAATTKFLGSGTAYTPR